MTNASRGGARRWDSSSIAAALEALPAGAGLVRLIARISAGGWFEFYDLFMTGYIALGLVRSGLFAATGTGLASLAGFIAAAFAGMFCGTALLGSVADRFGRKAIFTWSLVFYSLATCAMAFAPSALAIDVLRFAAGLGIGMQIVTIDAYIAEIAPKGARGRFIALSQAIGFTAVPVVALLAFRLVPHTVAGLDGWRVVALLGGIGAVIAWPIQAGLPESPRWLASRGRSAQAHAALQAIHKRTSSPTQAPPVTVGGTDPGAQTSSQATAVSAFDRAYGPRTLMLAAFNVFQTIGFYGFAAWMPTLLNARGITVAKSLEYAAIIAIVTPLGPLLALRRADRFERKHQIATLAIASAACALSLAWLQAPWAIVAFGSLITLVNTWFSCAFHAYQAELYPTGIRAGAVGFAYSWSRLSSILVGYIYAFVLRAHGATAAFVTIAAAMVMSATIVGLFGPRTGDTALEVLAPEARTSGA